MDHDTHPAPSMQAYTDRLNKKYGRDPVRVPGTARPLSANELADLQQFQAERDAQRALELTREERLRAWVLAGESTYRSQASKDAYDAAKKNKPSKCTRCQKEERLYGHHVVPYAQLKKEGRHTDPAAHIYEWLCLDCHAAAHPTISKLIRATTTGRIW